MNMPEVNIKELLLSTFARQRQHPDIISAIFNGAPRVSVSGLWGSSVAMMLASLYEQTRRSLLVITPSRQKAESLVGDLQTLYLLSSDDDAKRPQGILPLKPLDVSAWEEEFPGDHQQHELLKALRLFFDQRGVIAVGSIDSVIRLVPPRSIFQDFSMEISTGSSLVPYEQLTTKLVQFGYHRVEVVDSYGEYAVRGGVIDVYSPDNPLPLRIEYTGDIIETMRQFDPYTQRTVGSLKGAKIYPAAPAHPHPRIIEHARNRLEQLSQDGMIPDDKAMKLFDDLLTEQRALQFEYLLPLFYDKLQSIFDYLSPETLIVMVEEETARERFQPIYQSLRRDYETSAQDRFQCPFEELFLSPGQADELMSRFQQVSLNHLILEHLAEDDCFELQIENPPLYKGKIENLANEMKELLAYYRHLVLLLPNENMVRSLLRALTEFELDELFYLDEQGDYKPKQQKSSHLGQLHIATGNLSSGLVLPEGDLLLLSSYELFREKIKQPKSPPRVVRFISSLRDLKVGDYIVHSEHGIGLYKGLVHLATNGTGGEFILLEYAGNDKLYLPLDNLHLVQKYRGGDACKVTLDRLGGTRWQRVKERVKESVREMAEELLKLYSEREALTGYPFAPDTHWQAEFEADFEYEETEDQLRAVAEIKKDMESPRIMDRLVCGDVGYGKTEVAMRAAFKAVIEGKQVALLCPTTVLAQQHLETFRARFKNFPVKIDMISRFRSAAECRDIEKKLKTGDIDIIIGTHKLLGSKIDFRDLGLLIIDEEQRFGVVQKERLKEMRKKVDVLTLTATPIPRTLYMSISGIREISMINTPPLNRRAIKTHICKFQENVIRDAMRYELDRGGQVYFVHNRIDTIDKMASFLQRLVPEAKIVIGHGQMSESKLERIMYDFARGKYDILVSTTIIENGLDIPTVNTIIINRADRFGLAQLYQLRGRVGRDRYQAHAYLLVPSHQLVSDVARKRLTVLRELRELGSGFKLAAHDLEIRGAGNLLGPEQHGHIQAVGFDMYCKLLKDTVAELKGEHVQEDFEVTMRLKQEAKIPAEYIPDTNLRILVYQRLANAKSKLELVEIRQELSDRFGKLPKQAEMLIEKMALRLSCLRLGIDKVEVKKGAIHLTFKPDAPIEPRSFLRVIGRSPNISWDEKTTTMQISVTEKTESNPFDYLQQVLSGLSAIGQEFAQQRS